MEGRDTPPPSARDRPPSEAPARHTRVHRRSPLPQTRAELLAYGCGERLARADEQGAAATAAAGLVPTSWMLKEERAVYFRLPGEEFLRWWWRGWTAETARRAEKGE